MTKNSIFYNLQQKGPKICEISLLIAENQAPILKIKIFENI